MAFPAEDALSNSENTEGTQKQLYEDWLAATKELPGAVDEAAAVIAAGMVTVASSLIVADTESSASTDNLDYITTAEGSELRVIVLRATDAGRVITVRHGQGGIGQILLYGAANAVLDAVTKSVVLVKRGDDWVEVTRSWLPAASETAAGIAELATQAEAEAGTDDARIITPLKLRNAFNASGTAPVYACRAWGNVNGTGTPAVTAGGNVSSITDHGVGSYTINFATALPSANYAPVFGASPSESSGSVGAWWVGVATDGSGVPITKTTTALKIRVTGSAGTNVDAPEINFALFN